MNPSVSFRYVQPDQRLQLASPLEGNAHGESFGLSEVTRFRTNTLATLKADSDVIVAQTDTDIVGIIGWSDHTIQGLFVHPAYQRCGIGTRLVMAAHMLALSLNSPLVGVSSATASAFGFYRKMGFEFPTGAEAESFANLRG